MATRFGPLQQGFFGLPDALAIGCLEQIVTTSHRWGMSIPMMTTKDVVTSLTQAGVVVFNLNIVIIMMGINEFIAAGALEQFWILCLAFEFIVLAQQ